jgi:chromosome segregation ATPase
VSDEQNINELIDRLRAIYINGASYNDLCDSTSEAADVLEMLRAELAEALKERDALRTELDENVGVIAVWRRRTNDAEAELAAERARAEALQADVDKYFRWFRDMCLRDRNDEVAADRLRQHYESLTTHCQIVEADRERLRAELAEARRENERLREALDTIECETYSTSIRDIARAALIGREVNKEECFTSSEIIEGLKAELAEAQERAAVVERSIADLAGVLRDAERYRYWRDHHGWSGYFDNGATNSDDPAEIDAAIDAARGEL